MPALVSTQTNPIQLSHRSGRLEVWYSAALQAVSNSSPLYIYIWYDIEEYLQEARSLPVAGHSLTPARRLVTELSFHLMETSELVSECLDVSASFFELWGRRRACAIRVSLGRRPDWRRLWILVMKCRYLLCPCAKVHYQSVSSLNTSWSHIRITQLPNSNIPTKAIIIFNFTLSTISSISTMVFFNPPRLAKNGVVTLGESRYQATFDDYTLNITSSELFDGPTTRVCTEPEYRKAAREYEMSLDGITRTSRIRTSDGVPIIYFIKDGMTFPWPDNKGSDLAAQSLAAIQTLVIDYPPPRKLEDNARYNANLEEEIEKSKSMGQAFGVYVSLPHQHYILWHWSNCSQALGTVATYRQAPAQSLLTSATQLGTKEGRSPGILDQHKVGNCCNVWVVLLPGARSISPISDLLSSTKCKW